MPGGRGFRQGGRGGRQKLFFLESCLLALLRRAPSYGYSLMDGLTEFGFQPEQMDISILYRALRELETLGLVVSSWGDESLGPQRRIYTLTPAGETTLADWIAALRQRRREIEALEAAYAAAQDDASP